jgi:hypothetical protein
MVRLHNYLKLLFNLIVLLNFALFNGCTNHQARSSNRNSFVVYIKSKTENIGISEGEFGDIVQLEILSMNESHLSDDYYFDWLPKISPNGDKIIFLSNPRNEVRKTFLSDGGPFDIFEYSFESKLIKNLSNQYFIDSLRGIVRDLAWDNDNESFYVLLNSDQVLKYTFSINSFEIIWNAPEDINIRNIRYNFDLNSIVFNYSLNKEFKSHLALYNLKDKIIIGKELFGIIKLFSFENSERIILSFNSKIYTYNLIDGTESFLVDQKLDSDIYIAEIAKFSRNEYLILGEKDNESQLYLYDISSKSTIPLTNDKFSKECLDLYAPNTSSH